jgi:pSer/pThr/pTyr-binding forkhead associated (FHA) protein
MAANDDLVAVGEGGPLDDRSLNGVFVNGERVEWSTLADGDEVVIGRHHLHFINLQAVSGVGYARSPDLDSEHV